MDADDKGANSPEDQEEGGQDNRLSACKDHLKAPSVDTQQASVYTLQAEGDYQMQPVSAEGNPPDLRTHSVVVTQPVPVRKAAVHARPVQVRPVHARPVQVRPRNYLIPSVIACMCCFWPTGVCAVIYALKASTLADDGDFEGAQNASNKALMLIIASVMVMVSGFGFLFIISST